MNELDTHVCIIGAGVSSLCTSIQLIRNYNTRNFTIIEKTNQLGGTWSINTYLGGGCDWSEKFALQPEILAYLKGLAAKYGLEEDIRYGTAHSRSKLLVSAVGGLSVPKECELPTASEFKGGLFHSALWDHSFDWKNKDIVVVGNGCSATQFVPVMSRGGGYGATGAKKSIVQFANQAHWLAERENPTYSPFFKWVLRWVPHVMRTYRWCLYWDMEKDFRAFGIESGVSYRADEQAIKERYIRENAPRRTLISFVPKSDIGRKRRVYDTDYLASLHCENIELVYEDPVKEIFADGVRTKSGRVIPADAIILATGFQTQAGLAPMEVYGQGGISVNEHWKQVSEGTRSAYFGTCLAGFPNFFLMMGPNTLSGHLSVIYTTECQVNFIMRVIKPIIKSLNKKKLKTIVESVAVMAEAEAKDIDETQAKASKLV
ncbi:hypothetical protein F5Y16DRAFT_420787 [Xylariaceae sp. FL0255]|nr:hypothetical protein F5Y16DRAFT_420787 [Xylariaceae sp. FL0255]